MANRKLVAMNWMYRNGFPSFVFSTAFDRPVQTPLSIDWIQPKTLFDWNHLLNRLIVCVKCCSRTKQNSVLDCSPRLNISKCMTRSRYPRSMMSVHSAQVRFVVNNVVLISNHPERLECYLYTSVVVRCSFSVFLSIHCVDVFEWEKNSTLLLPSLGVATTCEQQLYIQYYLCWDCLFRIAVRRKIIQMSDRSRDGRRCVEKNYWYFGMTEKARIDEDGIVIFCVALRDFEDAQHIDKNW